MISKFRLKEDHLVCVIGLGRFGSAVADLLMENNIDVLMIDNNKHKLENLPKRLEEKYDQIHSIDATVLSSLSKEDVKEVNVGIVAIGDDVQANILAAINLKELGVGYVIVKAHNKLHGKLLERVGIDEVIYPEHDSASQLVRQLTSNNLFSSLDLTKRAAIVSIQITSTHMIGKSLRELKIRERFGCNVVAFQKGDEVVLVQDGTEIIDYGHFLILIGYNENIEQFEQFLMERGRGK